jgi:type IV fimbrial biogenesis protein FimT
MMMTPAYRSKRLAECWATPRARAASGFTLVELVMAVVVTAILIALAAPAFAAFIANQRASTAASDLYMALTTARSEATKRATNVTLSPATGGWQNGWVIADPAVSGSNVLAHGALIGAAVTGPDTVVFQRSGRVQGSTSPSFTLTLATGSSTSKKCVLTDLSGRPYIKSC